MCLLSYCNIFNASELSKVKTLSIGMQELCSDDKISMISCFKSCYNVVKIPKVSFNNISNYTFYRLIVKTSVSYSNNNIDHLYDRDYIFKSVLPNTIFGGNFNITDLLGNLVLTNNASIDISSGIISLKKLINVQKYSLNIKYNLNNNIVTTVYNITILPNIYYTISSIITNYINPVETLSPYYTPTNNGLFTMYDLSNSNLVLNNFANINQYGIITFNKSINVGQYSLKINYTQNNITNYTILRYSVNPILFYHISKLILLYDQSGTSFYPTYLQSNGIFSINDYSGNYLIASNNMVSINSNTGIISFNNNINIGIYYLKIIYALNNTFSSFIYELNILPTIFYIDLINYILYDRPTITYSLPPIYNPSNGIFTIIDNIGKLVYNNYVSIISNTGVIQFNKLIDVGIYSFTVIYNLNPTKNSCIYTLYVMPNLLYNPLITTINHNTSSFSSVPYYSQLNGIFSIDNAQINFVSIDSNTGIISFNKGISIGVYNIYIQYLLNGVKNNITYVLNIIPTLNYSISNKKIYYGNIDKSVIPIVSQSNGIFILSDLSNNIYINKSTGVLTFGNTINVGIYILNISYILNSATNYFKYNLSVYPIINYDPPFSSISLNYSKSVTPLVQQNNGLFYIYDSSGYELSSNIATITQNGIIIFNNSISTGTYIFTINYKLNELITKTLYTLNVKPTLLYNNLFYVLYYGNTFNSGIPQYQVGGTFIISDISGYLWQNNMITFNSDNGLINFTQIPVGIYNLLITYTLNSSSNYANIILNILPLIKYNINSKILTYNTSDKSVMPIVQTIGGIFSMNDYYKGIYIDASSGIIYINNNTDIGTYNIKINYFLNLVSNSTNYNLSILPKCYYANNYLTGLYGQINYSDLAICDPSGGIFTIMPTYTDISSYNITMNNINSDNIKIDKNNGVISFNSLFNIIAYNLTTTFTYNNISNSTNLVFINKPLLYYNIPSLTINYYDISFSCLPYVNPVGGYFNATVNYINLQYTGISIDKNTGILKFESVNPGFWKITINYTINNIIQTVDYNLRVIADIYYSPPFMVISCNTENSTFSPITVDHNGQYSCNTIIKGLSIDLVTGILIFSNINTGIYNIAVTYTTVDKSTIINYTLIVKPEIIYNPAYISTSYNTTNTSVMPIVIPSNGTFNATFDDLTSLQFITIDSISGYINILPNLMVNKYQLLINYIYNNLIETVNYSITVYPILNYINDSYSTKYNTVNYSESPYINPKNGSFYTNAPFYVDISSGIIEFTNTISVGQYTATIEYIYNSISVFKKYYLKVYPQYYYSTNYLEIANRTKSVLPWAKQESGTFSYVTISGLSIIPYTLSILNTSEQYNDLGIILNKYNGILNFGNNIIVGKYVLSLAYTLNTLSTITTFTFIAKPYFNYESTTLILDYNTSAISSTPVVLQSGGTFYFSQISDLTTEFNNIIINSKTGIINFYRGIKVGKYSITVSYVINQISSFIIYLLTIKPIFNYGSSINYTVFNVDYYSDSPIIVPSLESVINGYFEIIDYNNVSIDNISIDHNTGILYITGIQVNSYNFILQFTINNFSVSTTYNLIVKPSFYYDNNTTTLTYSKLGYSNYPVILNPGGTFGFVDNTTITAQSVINTNNGQICFSQYINIGTYELNIYYSYNGIKNTLLHNLIIIPLFQYTISGVLLKYDHLQYLSVLPITQPTKGLFYFSDNSNNYPLKEINLNKKNGIITVNNLDVGNYNININYYLKNSYSLAKYIITILPTFYYQSNVTVIYYSLNINNYSVMPFISPLGGTFNFFLPIDYNLINNMDIDTNTGQIKFNSYINAGTYLFNIYYNINNSIQYCNYKLIVYPLFFYNESINTIIYKSYGLSSVPIVSQNNGTFNINNMFNISGFFINTNTGLIKINNNLNIGSYKLNIIYSYLSISSFFDYLIQIVPNVYYPISNQIINYGYKYYSYNPINNQNNGIFQLDTIYYNTGIVIDLSSGILLFNSNVSVNNYLINIYYKIDNTIQTIYYNLSVLPVLYYDSSNISITYGTLYYSQIPFINPKGGIFNSNLGTIDSTGIFTIKNLDPDTYNLNIKYIYNTIQTVYSIKILIYPDFYYPSNFQYNIYNNSNYSLSPYYKPSNGYFYSDLSNIYINSTGIIQFDPNQDIGHYKINIFYSLNYMSKSTNYFYNIIPYIKYTESQIQTYNGTSITSSIPLLLPSKGVLKTNYVQNIIDNSGVLFFDSKLFNSVGYYYININYSFGDLSNNFLYTLKVLPYIYYVDKTINYGIISKSEIPINNSYGGIFTLEFDIKTIINISSIIIDISNGLITFNSDLLINKYLFYVHYLINNISYTHVYHLIVQSNIIYQPIKINQYSTQNIYPLTINPTGGVFTINNQFYNTINPITGIISSNYNNYIGKYNLSVKYLYSTISSIFNLQVTVNPYIYYNNTLFITYNSFGFSDYPYTSISGGIFYSNNLPAGLTINPKTGVFNYNGINVNKYVINVNYLLNDLSGTAYFNLIVKPYINYSTPTFITYGSYGSSVIPIIHPSEGIFNLSNYNQQIFIDKKYGIITFGNNIKVGTYMIPVNYSFNDLSSSFIFNLNINTKLITSIFTTKDKIYDESLTILIASNKLIGVVNNDQVFITNYNSILQNIGPATNIPIIINDIILGGSDSYNYIINSSNSGIANIYLFSYDPSYIKANHGSSGTGTTTAPILSSYFNNPSFLLTNISISKPISTRNIINNKITINYLGIIEFNYNLEIGIYYITIYAYNTTFNSTFVFTLEITQNLYLDTISVISPNQNIINTVYQLQYTSNSGKAYVINNDVNGLLSEFSILSYNNNILSNMLDDSYAFKFRLSNADISSNLVVYKLNDDKTVNYSISYKMNYIGDNQWTTQLRYLSNYYIIDLSLFSYNQLPTFDPIPGTYYTSSTIDVTIKSLLSSTIYYTLDGTNPTIYSTVFITPIQIKKSVIIKTFAVTTDNVNSPINIATYIIYEVPCLLAKTLIRTPDGDQLIDNLREGDMIITDLGIAVPIIKILYYTIENPNNKSFPVCIKKDYFEFNIPSQDTFISQNHAIKLNNLWIYGGDHISYFNLHKIKPIYYHIMLPNYFTDNLIANNMVVESWSGLLPKNGLVKYTNKNTTKYNNKEYITYTKTIRLINMGYHC